MEFNPLDLLACAAEIQQRHDDSPDPAIMTRQRRSNSLTAKRISTNNVHKEAKLNSQKENKDITNNNVKNNGITVVRKLKIAVNSDLEKMLDEHNYGNAKKGFKYEKGLDRVSADSLPNRGSTDSVSPETPSNVNEVSESDSTQTMSICDGDLSSEITCRLRDHESDVENSCEALRQSVSLLSDSQTREDSKLCVEPGSSTSHTGTLTPTQVDSVQHLPVDKAKGHSVDTHPVKDKPCKQISSPEGDVPLDKHTCLGHEHQQTQNGSQVQEVTPTVVSRENRVSISEEQIVREVEEVCEDSDITLCLSEKQGQVSVGSVPLSSAAAAEPPQTVIINISKQHSSSSVATTILLPQAEQGSCVETLQQPSCDNDDNIKSTTTELPIIRSMLTTTESANLKSPQSTTAATDESVSQEQNPELPQTVGGTGKCDSFDFSAKSVSCESLKRTLELSGSLCTDSAVNSVHLLSPDRRNPDSMGVSESPITEIFSATGDDLVEAEMTEIGANNCDKNSNSALCVKNEVEKELPSCDECTSASESKTGVSPVSGEPRQLPTNETAKESDIVESPCELESRRLDNADNIDKDTPIFRFVSDHCYAGVPGKSNIHESLEDQDGDLLSEEANTPSVCSTGELSQDSGYGDITQSPVHDTPAVDSHAPKNLIPVLISVNENGSLTIHNDATLANNLAGQLVAVPDAMKSIDATKVLSGSQILSVGNLPVADKQAENKLITSPLILSPVGKSCSPILTDTRLVFKNDNIIGVLRPTTPDIVTNQQKLAQSSHTQISPPKFGKFKIGTFASFSNSEIGLDDNAAKLNMSPPSKTVPCSKTSPDLKPLGMKPSPAYIDTLGTIVQKINSSILPSSEKTDIVNLEFIQHDHDYCMKNLTPSVVNTATESRPQREISKGKVTHNKTKKSDNDVHKTESKSQKRVKKCHSVPHVIKEDTVDDFELEEGILEDDPDGQDMMRPKTRAMRYIEQKSVEPKVKITGSSVFQDQFVYFMNTKKRSRRRESHELPFSGPRDRIWVPPKPGDIIVPHLSDAELEKIKQRGKDSKYLGQNLLRADYLKSYSQHSSQVSQSDTSFDEESKIINTILSLENEDMTAEPSSPSYSESMEIYNPTNDILNFSPEQMNLTQEQMDILFSAVDEVQNSSPGLVGSEKLASPAPGDPTFGQFPSVTPTYESTEVTAALGETDAKSAMDVDGVPSSPAQEIAPVAVDVSAPLAPATTESTDQKSETTELSPSADIPTSMPPDIEQTVADIEQTVAEPPSPIQTSSPIEAEGILETTSDEGKMEVGATVDGEIKPEIAPEYKPPVQTDLPSDHSESVMKDRKNPPFVGSVEPDGTSSSVKSLLQSPTPSSTAISGSINTDLQLPPLDRSSLDMLVGDGNEFRLYKSEFFPESSESPRTYGSTMTNTPMAMPMDYNAPWIVMVSMYWNDLPAIMINNLPFVRLVDIHKQILPAKDTGILKKRCQLMGVRVLNCSEMQRYFLVQYGKAFNSKSTLIVSKDDAKVLIGYYVDPQPKAKPHEDRKSIIEHRRLQLRRIALARRAAIRAEREKVSGVKSPGVDSAGLETGIEFPTDPCRLSEVKPVEASPIPPVPQNSSTPVLQTQGSRSTRHKKINFLKMLHGDSPGHSTGESGDGEKLKKPQRRRSADGNSSAKRCRNVKKQVKKRPKFTELVTDSSSEDVDDSSDSSEYSDSSDSNSDYEVDEIPVLKPRNMVRQNSPCRKKDKGKLTKPVPVKASVVRVPPLKVKVRAGFPAPKAKIKVISTAAAVPAVNKVEKVSPKLSNTQTLGGHRTSTSPCSFSPPVVLGRVLNLPTGDESSIVVPAITCDSKALSDGSEQTVQCDIKDSPDNHDNGTQPAVVHSEAGTCVSGDATEYLPVNENGTVTHKSGISDSNEDIECSGELERNKTVTIKCDTFTTNTEAIAKRRSSTPLADVDKTQVRYSDDAIVVSDESDISHDDLSQTLETETASEGVDTESKQNSLSDVNHSVKSGDETVLVEAHPEQVACTDKTEIINECSYSKTNVDMCTSSSNSNSNDCEMSKADCVLISNRSRSLSSDSRSQSPLVTEIGDRGIVSVRRKEIVHIGLDEVSISVVHRDASPQINGHRNRSQLGEVFVDRYSNKKSMCVRCYTCRKMMSVDGFLRHLHDVVSGGLVAMDTARTIAATECDLTENERKLWETFQRKKELFDNNQLPSPGVVDESIVYNVDSDSNLSMPEKVLGTLKPVEREKGPIVIQTPVSRGSNIRKGKDRSSSGSRSNSNIIKSSSTSGIHVERTQQRVARSQSVSESTGVRSSSRKRKLKKMYPDEDYLCMKKLPRLSSEMTEDNYHDAQQQTNPY